MAANGETIEAEGFDTESYWKSADLKCFSIFNLAWFFARKVNAMWTCVSRFHSACSLSIALEASWRFWWINEASDICLGCLEEMIHLDSLWNSFMTLPSKNVKCTQLPINSSIKSTPFDNRSRIFSWYPISIRLQHPPNLVQQSSIQRHYKCRPFNPQGTTTSPSPIFRENKENYKDNFSARLRALPNKEKCPLVHPSKS